jgi:hypothetical protein
MVLQVLVHFLNLHITKNYKILCITEKFSAGVKKNNSFISELSTCPKTWLDPDPVRPQIGSGSSKPVLGKV